MGYLVRKLFSAVVRVFDRVITGLGWFSGIIILFMMMAIFYEVIMRYFFNRPTIWVSDFSEYMMLYITFLAVAWVLKNEGHIGIDFVPRLLSPRAAATLKLITLILGLAVSLIVTWKGIEVTLYHFEKGFVQPHFILVPNFVLLMVIPLGWLLLSGQFLRQIGETAFSIWGKQRREERMPQLKGDDT